jgi:Mg-chelatase subunit ChlD
MNQNFLCPITQALMMDPVIGSDGITYERSAIEAWFAMGKTTSPMTRQPMASTSLVPNYALKAMIEEGSRDISPITTLAATKFEAPTPTITVTKSGKQYHVSVTVPDGEQYTKPTLFIDVLDISGSMGNPAAESATAGEAALFSRADLVRHSVATQIELLRPQDELAVILFDNNATVALPPTQMTGTGRMVAKAILPQITPRGGTNIWNGLHKALTLATTADTINKNVVIILQTDGESDPSYNPPRGIPAAAQAWLDTNNKTHVTVHTVGYGFGRSLDMPLLQQLATIGHGTVNYIPDGSMVGTVFIHLMANLMSTAYTGLQVQVPEAGICEPIHFLQAGQSRDFIIKTELDTFTVAVTGSTTAETKVTAATAPIDMSVAVHDARASACTFIETMLAGGEAGEDLTSLKYRATPGWLRMQDTHRSDPSFYENPSIVALRTDFDHPDPNKGQISKAVATAAAFNKWGRHYLPCYLSGLRNQWAINFKDEASKLFGSDYTKSLIERGERLFNDLPAPQASHAPRGAAPISMYAVNNAGGGCFLHGSLVKMANGKYRRCEELKAGDLVYNGYKIRCVVKTTLPSVEFVALGTVEKGKEMLNVGGFTAWHPVKMGEHWAFPADIGRIQTIHGPTTVYNFVLEQGHTLIVNGITACTLAHDFTGPVIGHSYFGKREPGVRHVLDDLEAHPDWPAGLIHWAPQIHRDSKTGLITGMSATK